MLLVESTSCLTLPLSNVNWWFLTAIAVMEDARMYWYGDRKRLVCLSDVSWRYEMDYDDTVEYARLLSPWYVFVLWKCDWESKVWIWPTVMQTLNWEVAVIRTTGSVHCRYRRHTVRCTQRMLRHQSYQFSLASYWKSSLRLGSSIPQLSWGNVVQPLSSNPALKAL